MADPGAISAITLACATVRMCAERSDRGALANALRTLRGLANRHDVHAWATRALSDAGVRCGRGRFVAVLS